MKNYNILGGSLKNPTFTGGVHENQYRRGIALKGEACTVCKKEGVVFLRRG